jgi:hypothetical protein
MLIQINRRLARVDHRSTRFRRGLWLGVTRGGSLHCIAAMRQVIRGSRATVYLKLTCSDGSVVRDSESLVRRRGRWLIG